ncbi:MAG: peptide-methionine (S)-S-oxide reductase MsrA [Proteobacteria bacterium]|nr:peptide-methionine (S)-S-oxide reductase MsrA [Pseudomonadota bacterium]
MFDSLLKSKSVLPTADTALPGRATPILANPAPHAVHNRSIVPPFPRGAKRLLVGMGCFWGAERLFWQLAGVWTTSVGYAGGFTPNPSYQEVCSGQTGHTEVVEVVYLPGEIGLEAILKVFWQEHDPTQGMRQGNDRGSQYRSALYGEAGEVDALKASRNHYQQKLSAQGKANITTEIAVRPAYYLAEDYHQQYLHKTPHGYCGLAGCGVDY